jgi:hypothetical protein
VADRLFLAPKTVGNVLGRVYEKLGIHTRAELGAMMAVEAPAGPGHEPEPGRAGSGRPSTTVRRGD